MLTAAAGGAHQVRPDPGRASGDVGVAVLGDRRAGSRDNQHRRLVRDGYWTSHDGPLPIVAGSVIRVEIERLPGGGKPAGPMWLWCRARRTGPGHDLRRLPAAVRHRAHLPAPRTRPRLDHTRAAGPRHRAALELAGATRLHPAAPGPRPRPGPAAVLGKPVPPDRLSPRRVRRDFRRVHAQLGTEANPPKTTQPGPGRPQAAPDHPAPDTPPAAKTADATPRKPPPPHPLVKTRGTEASTGPCSLFRSRSKRLFHVTCAA